SRSLHAFRLAFNRGDLRSRINYASLALSGFGPSSDDDDKKNDSPVDSSAAAQSNLTLLLRKSKTPSPPDLQIQPPTPQATINASFPQIRTNDDDNSNRKRKEESRPLLPENRVNSYGSRDPVDDLALIEESDWGWLPCFGDHSLIPHHGREEWSRPRIQITPKNFFQIFILNPISYIPAVILGLLLNLLDAISYGLITFPINNPIFADLGPDGISMFFVRAEIIVNEIGEDKQAIIATTIFSFALSSVLTGVVFLLLGAFKLGSLIEFFPRHILVGCIGGVGWFLVATAIEVSARLDSNLTFSYEMFRTLFLDLHTLSLWSSALILALILRSIQHK
ncbi:9687_t:CDS:2, partial [Acaulospora colombiana]